MRKPVAALEISVGQRELLESVARSQSGAHREVVRAKALLMASQRCRQFGYCAGIVGVAGLGGELAGTVRRGWDGTVGPGSQGSRS